MSGLVISLTSVPPRFRTLGACLASLLDQSLKADNIHLFIPRRYRRFPGEFTMPDVPDGVTVHVVEEDFGPATKVLPAVRLYRGTRTRILFCDDDMAYNTHLASRLDNAANVRPNHCIAERGSHVTEAIASTKGPQNAATFRKKDLRYRLKRAASLGHWKPPLHLTEGYVDLLAGCAGCLIEPHFLPDVAFDIPDTLWTVDDVWLSGCLALNDIPIWLTAPKAAHIPKKLQGLPRDAALKNFVYRGHGRKAADKACIAHFKDNFGIWSELPI